MLLNLWFNFLLSSAQTILVPGEAWSGGKMKQSFGFFFSSRLIKVEWSGSLASLSLLFLSSFLIYLFIYSFIYLYIYLCLLPCLFIYLFSLLDTVYKKAQKAALSHRLRKEKRKKSKRPQIFNLCWPFQGTIPTYCVLSISWCSGTN